MKFTLLPSTPMIQSSQMKITEVLSREEIQQLIKPSDWRGFQAVATTWGMIAACFALVATYPSWFTVMIAWIILGGRHLALAILMHDAAHYSLFKTRHFNDWVGRWLCAYPTWQDIFRYRSHHLQHHRFAGTEKDPDLSLVRGFPLSKASLLRKFTRDLVGITGLKRIYGLLLMDLEIIKYTVGADVQRCHHPGRTWKETLQIGFKNMRGMILTNLALFSVLYAFGHPALYGLWVLSYLTSFSLFLRIRSIAEHACTDMDLSPTRNTRSTLAGGLARITVAPHRVNFHLEHHLLMTVPYFNLPVLHRILKERGALQNAHVAMNYRSVLKLAVRSS